MKMGGPVKFLPPYSDRELTDEERHLHQYRERFSEDDVEGIVNPSPRDLLPRRGLGLGWRLRGYLTVLFWIAIGLAFFAWLVFEVTKLIVVIFT